MRQAESGFEGEGEGKARSSGKPSRHDTRLNVALVNASTIVIQLERSCPYRVGKVYGEPSGLQAASFKLKARSFRLWVLAWRTRLVVSSSTCPLSLKARGFDYQNSLHLELKRHVIITDIHISLQSTVTAMRMRLSRRNEYRSKISFTEFYEIRYYQLTKFFFSH